MAGLTFPRVTRQTQSKSRALGAVSMFGLAMLWLIAAGSPSPTGVAATTDETPEQVAAAIAAGTAATTEEAGFDAKAAERFAKLALACVHKEYPNKIAHVLNSDADVAPPRKLTPAFCGCYDWHSSVHGHWLLVRLLRTFPDAPFAKDARDAVKQSLTAENLKTEDGYLRGDGRANFERPEE